MENKITKHRVVTFLTREELEFLDKLEKDIMFSTGAHISRSQILENLAELIAKTDMDASGVRDNRELEKRMVEAIARMGLEQLKAEGKA